MFDDQGWPLTSLVSSLGTSDFDADPEAVPQPASITLMAAGAAAVLALRHRLRKAPE